MGLRADFKAMWEMGGLSFKGLASRVWQQVNEDDVWAYAAQLAYFFLFAIFPFFIFLAALLAYVPVPDLLDRMLDGLAQVMPAQVLGMIEDNLRDIVNRPRGGLLSFGILFALWTASSAVAAVMRSLNRAYGVPEERSFLKARGLAILITIGTALLLPAAVLLLIFGPQLGEWLANMVGLGNAFAIVWNILRWPVIVFLMILAAAIIYYLAPNVEQDWKWITPGSALAVLLWILASLLFAYYIDNFGDYNATYGSIGAVIVLLTWLYLTGFFLLLGGEINAEIERAAGKRVPGKKELRH